MFTKLIKKTMLFSFGGAGYCLVELLWRGDTHWSMYITGGLCFYIIGALNRTILCGHRLWTKCAAGAGIITCVEFVCGCIVNIWLGLSVWDYTPLPLNIMGQVSLLYSVYWYILSAPLSSITRHMDMRFKIE